MVVVVPGPSKSNPLGPAILRPEALDARALRGGSGPERRATRTLEGPPSTWRSQEQATHPPRWGRDHLVLLHPCHPIDQETAMYDMYPDWGPAKNDPDHPLHRHALQASLDLRDHGGERPDDN